ncbi:MAG: YceI family protein [Paludibacter sp.]
MIKRKLSWYCMLALVGIIAISGNALTAQSLKINPKTSSMTIFGTTNVHDFQSKVTQISGELVISSKEAQSLVVEIPVKSIKSGEKLMDTKTYETFKADKNPNITFKMTDASGLQVNGSDISVTVTGNLTMGGATRKIALKAAGKIVRPGVYQFKGSVPLKMTDFKMSPPTAMLGVMKVGDAVTLKYDVTFEGPAIN